MKFSIKYLNLDLIHLKNQLISIMVTHEEGWTDEDM